MSILHKANKLRNNMLIQKLNRNILNFVRNLTYMFDIALSLNKFVFNTPKYLGTISEVVFETISNCK